MSKTLAAFVPPLAALALVLPGRAVAGPPEGASGRMVFDEVADGLRKYRAEQDQEKRYERLRRLAPTHDPRIAVVLGESLDSQEDILCVVACRLLDQHFVTGPKPPARRVHRVSDWWDAHEADLRRRAKQLPR
jgi:hypothetical protein